MAASKSGLLAITSLGHFVNDGTTFFVPVVAALLASGHGISPLEITAMLVVYYTTSSLLSLYVGRWADRTGRPMGLMALGMALLGVGMAGFYVALVLFTGAEGFAMAVVATFLVGFGGSFYHPLGATLLQGGYERKDLGTALGINGALGSVGRAIYPTLFFLVGLALTGGSSLLVFATVGFVTSLVMMRGWSSPRRSESTGSSDKAAPAKGAFTIGIVALTVVAFVRSAANLGIVAFLPTYLQYVRPLWGGAPLGVEVTIMYLGGIIGQPIFGLLVGRFDVRALLSTSSLGSALFTIGFLLVSGPAAIGFLFLIGVFTFSAFPLLMTLSSEHVDRKSTSLANSLVFGLGTGLGGAIGPLLVGLISSDHYTQLPVGFYAMAGLGIVAAIMVTAIPPVGSHRARMPLFG